MDEELASNAIYEDTFKVAAEFGPENSIKEYVYGTSVNSADYMKIGDDFYRILKDNLGSPRLVVKASDGSVAQKMSYNEWGKVIEDTNPGFQPFGFAGGLYDVDTKLVKFGAREYDGSVGRWLSKDPILFEGGDTNLYGYVLQDPVNSIDSTGQFAIAPLILVPILFYLKSDDPYSQLPIENVKDTMAEPANRNYYKYERQRFIDDVLSPENPNLKHRKDILKDFYKRRNLCG